MMDSKVLVVVVSWNNCEDTIVALKSLLRQSYKGFDIALVDNGSEDLYRVELKQFSDLEDRIFWIENDTNLGFTKAVNRVIKDFVLDSDKYTHVALFNNDAVADVAWLEQLLFVADDDHVRVVASKIIQAKRPELLESAGLCLNFLGSVLAQGYNDNEERWNDSMRVLGASGGAVLYDVSVFGLVGLFDENFPMGYEDAEYAMRCCAYGIWVDYAPGAIVHHLGGVSLKKTPSFPRLVETQYNIWSVYFMYAPVFGLVWMFLLTGVRTLIKTLYWLLLFRWRSLRAWYSSLFLFFSRFGFLCHQRKVLRKSAKIPAWKFVRLHHGLISGIIR